MSLLRPLDWCPSGTTWLLRIVLARDVSFVIRALSAKNVFHMFCLVPSACGRTGSFDGMTGSMGKLVFCRFRVNVYGTYWRIL